MTGLVLTRVTACALKQHYFRSVGPTMPKFATRGQFFAANNMAISVLTFDPIQGHQGSNETDSSREQLYLTYEAQIWYQGATFCCEKHYNIGFNL